MKSPFPGMDPYIEAHGYLWEDFHNHLVDEIYRALASALPAPYFAQTGVRSYVVLVEAEGKTERPFLPDVAITSPGRGPSTKTDSVAVAEPTVEAGFEPVDLQAFVAEEYREAFVEIRELEGEQRLVTCIEVLSPSNKRRGSKGWKRFLRKRQALLLGEANLIEIDLLRAGTKMPMRDPWPASPYTVLVARSEKAPRCKVWPAHFQRALPTVPVPLESPDPDIPLDLQALIEAIYERSRYSGRIDYTKPLSPALSEPETAWLAERLRQRAAS